MTNDKISNKKSTYSANELKELFLDGSPEGFSLVYDLYSASVYGFVFTTLIVKEEAGVILSEVFMKAYQDRESFGQFQFSMLIWLIRIAAKICLEGKTEEEARVIKESILAHFFAQRMVVAE